MLSSGKSIIATTSGGNRRNITGRRALAHLEMRPRQVSFLQLRAFSSSIEFPTNRRSWTVDIAGAARSRVLGRSPLIDSWDYG